jgi:hypothetical protein
MRVITIKRTIRKSGKAEKSTARPSNGELSRKFLAAEHHFASALEAVLFSVLLGAVAWPIIAAVIAISQVLQNVAT